MAWAGSEKLLSSEIQISAGPFFIWADSLMARISPSQGGDPRSIRGPSIQRFISLIIKKS